MIFLVSECVSSKKQNIEAKIRSAVRKQWMQSEERKKAFVRSRIPCNDGSRRKWVEKGGMSGKQATSGEKEFKTKKDGTPSKVKRPILICHHVNGVENVWHPNFLKSMFCDSKQLQILCHDCHDDCHEKMHEKEK